MALTYEQSAFLMTDIIFRNKVKVACLKFADSIMIELPSVPGHASRYRWAQNAMVNPDGTAGLVTPPTVMDAAVQDAGVDAEGHSLIADAALQAAVETTVGKML